MDRKRPEDFAQAPGSSKYDQFAREQLTVLGADAFVVVVVGGVAGTGACPALRMGPDARKVAAALRVAFLQMADRIIADGERCAQEYERGVS